MKTCILQTPTGAFSFNSHDELTISSITFKGISLENKKAYFRTAYLQIYSLYWKPLGKINVHEKQWFDPNSKIEKK